jgi:hypothetical protein
METGSLDVQIHEPELEHNEFHAHVDFGNASMVSARLCLGCGAYVNGSFLVDHQRHHDRIQEALVRSAGSEVATPEQGSLF